MFFLVELDSVRLKSAVHLHGMNDDAITDLQVGPRRGLLVFRVGCSVGQHDIHALVARGLNRVSGALTVGSRLGAAGRDTLTSQFLRLLPLVMAHDVWPELNDL